MELTAGRNTMEMPGTYIVLNVKTGVKIFEGALVAIESGCAIPAKKATGLLAAGRAEHYVNSADTDAATIKVKRGTFLFDNDTTNPVADEHTLKDCYMLDDSTVTSLSTGASKAGKVLGFEDGQVIVQIS